MRKLAISFLSVSIMCFCSLPAKTCHASESSSVSLKQTIAKSGPRIGVINRDGVAGAISKEADKLFTQYANNKDTDGINQMLLKGELVYLPKGTRVILVEYGFLLHKIRTKEGQILYVAREHVTLDEPENK